MAVSFSLVVAPKAESAFRPDCCVCDVTPVILPPPDVSFRRSHRLLTPAEFQRVFDQAAIKVGSKHFLLLAAPQAQPGDQRIGFVVGRRNVRRAVDRNLIKRLAREHFRHAAGAFDGLDLVLLVRAKMLRPARQTTSTELASLLDKLLAKRGQA